MRQHPRKDSRQLNKASKRRKAKRAAAVASKPDPSRASPSPVQLEAELARLRALDSHAHLRGKLHEVAGMRDDWAGIPMPLADEELVVEPSHPLAEALNAIGRKDLPPDDDSKIRIRNSFWSTWRRATILAVEDVERGRVFHVGLPVQRGVAMLLRTIGCSSAWGVEQESRALNLLGTMLTHVQFKQYLLTGSFIESSKRSGLFYLFRKLRPTVAIGRTKRGDDMRALAALCMHPIAYYSDTWAGAMCPTDDVIAHLAMMRGDEPMFWRRCNQHPADRPEAGLVS